MEVISLAIFTIAPFPQFVQITSLSLAIFAVSPFPQIVQVIRLSLVIFAISPFPKIMQVTSLAIFNYISLSPNCASNKSKSCNMRKTISSFSSN